MKVAILAGGSGTRLSELTDMRPKPMVEVGGKPILWHLMKYYSHFGLTDFVVALGYKGEVIKRYFVDWCVLGGDLSIDLHTGRVERSTNGLPPWKLQLIDTGEGTETGGRIKWLKPALKDDTFILTWGDGLYDLDIEKLIEFHRSHGKPATLTTVCPQSRFGHMEMDGNLIQRFVEKPVLESGWINAGVFVLEPSVFDYIDADAPWERGPLEGLARDGQLVAYKHSSFWQCMDTLREQRLLEALWASGEAPWRVWG